MTEYIKLLLLLMFSCCANVNAKEFKLQCQISTKFKYPSGKIDNDIGNAIVEISDFGKLKFIFVISSNDVANNLSIMS